MCKGELISSPGIDKQQEIDRLGELLERSNALRREQQAVIDHLAEETRTRGAEIAKLQAEVNSWIADRDSWLARYEAVKKELDQLTARPCGCRPYQDLLDCKPVEPSEVAP